MRPDSFYSHSTASTACMKALPELPVLLGREAGHLFKHLGEIALVLITAGDRDFHDRIICVGQKPCRLFNTDSVKMLLECHSGHLPEQGGKIGCIYVQIAVASVISSEKFWEI